MKPSNTGPTPFASWPIAQQPGTNGEPGRIFNVGPETPYTRSINPHRDFTTPHFGNGEGGFKFSPDIPNTAAPFAFGANQSRAPNAGPQPQPQSPSPSFSFGANPSAGHNAGPQPALQSPAAPFAFGTNPSGLNAGPQPAPQAPSNPFNFRQTSSAGFNMGSQPVPQPPSPMNSNVDFATYSFGQPAQTSSSSISFSFNNAGPTFNSQQPQQPNFSVEDTVMSDDDTPATQQWTAPGPFSTPLVPPVQDTMPGASSTQQQEATQTPVFMPHVFTARQEEAMQAPVVMSDFPPPLAPPVQNIAPEDPTTRPGTATPAPVFIPEVSATQQEETMQAPIPTPEVSSAQQQGATPPPVFTPEATPALPEKTELQKFLRVESSQKQNPETPARPSARPARLTQLWADYKSGIVTLEQVVEKNMNGYFSKIVPPDELFRLVNEAQWPELIWQWRHKRLQVRWKSYVDKFGSRDTNLLGVLRVVQALQTALDDISHMRLRPELLWIDEKYFDEILIKKTTAENSVNWAKQSIADDNSVTDSAKKRGLNDNGANPEEDSLPKKPRTASTLTPASKTSQIFASVASAAARPSQSTSQAQDTPVSKTTSNENQSKATLFSGANLFSGTSSSNPTNLFSIPAPTQAPSSVFAKSASQETPKQAQPLSETAKQSTAGTFSFTSLAKDKSKDKPEQSTLPADNLFAKSISQETPIQAQPLSGMAKQSTSGLFSFTSTAKDKSNDEPEQSNLPVDNILTKSFFKENLKQAQPLPETAKQSIAETFSFTSPAKHKSNDKPEQSNQPADNFFAKPISQTTPREAQPLSEIAKQSTVEPFKSNVKSEPSFKVPSFGAPSSGNFMQQFGQAAKKTADEEKAKRKADEFDSDEDNEEEWEKKYEEEQQAKKVRIAEAASKGKGFEFKPTAITTPTKPLFSVPQAGTGSSTSLVGDQTWKPDSPIKFAESTGTVPTVSITAPSPLKPSIGFGGSIFEKEKADLSPARSLFGVNTDSNKEPNIQASSIFTQASSKPGSPSNAGSSIFLQGASTKPGSPNNTGLSLFSQGASTKPGSPSNAGSSIFLQGAPAKPPSPGSGSPSLFATGASAKSTRPSFDFTEKFEPATPSPAPPRSNAWEDFLKGKSQPASGSPGQSVFASLVPSRAASPATTTATVSGAETDDNKEGDNDADNFPKEAQLDLSNTNAGEEDEELLFTVKAKIQEFASDDQDDEEKTKSWRVRGIGELRVLRNKETHNARVVVRQEQSARVLLNTGLLEGISYSLVKPKLVNFAVAASDGTLARWLIQVGKEDAAKELSTVLEENKA